MDETIRTTAASSSSSGRDATPAQTYDIEATSSPRDAPIAIPPPDPCAVPVQGLDHPCIADGLTIGEAVYWDGGALPDLQQSGLGLDHWLGTDVCGPTTGCLEVAFDVAQTAPGSRLRVDAQVYFADPSHVRPLADSTCCGHESAVDMTLYEPGPDGGPGDVAASASTTGSFAASLLVGGYDADTRRPLDGPGVGTWTLRLGGFLPEDLRYRLRARLEPPAPPSDAPAFPDLRIIPPFEVGFMLPTTTFQPGLPLPAGAPVATCMAEEYAEAQTSGLPRPTMCLRFSMGFYNAGDGAFRLKEVAGGDAPEQMARRDLGLDDVAMVQSVCTADSRACRDLPRPERLVTRWHSTHLHFHYQNAYVFDLYRVVEAAGAAARPGLEHMGTSGKLGIDPASEAIEGWDRFYQLPKSAPAGRDRAGDPDPASNVLQAGWGDVYDWNRAGNYIDFPVDTLLRPVPGEYVIRGVTDPDRQIVETDETNNWSYTHIRVTGLGAVEVLERGYGIDPWDPTREPFEVAP